MSEAIIGGLIGGPLGAVIALLGNYFVIRDSRWGRVAAAEQQAAAKLLTVLRPVRMGDRRLNGWFPQWEFTEECYAIIFDFRDGKVRSRLNASISMIASAAEYRDAVGDEGIIQVQALAIEDVRSVLEARLDRKRLPQPTKAWTWASRNVLDAMEHHREEMEEALRNLEREQEAMDPPLFP
ncbi:hypothetical protein [Streptomyces sp. NPDC056405]|uniref:hypothetical protein n=1 Tax=Streptomyces sp. NPDC056405 TaxID=3345811 RepID=UPI0035D9639C